MNAKKAKLARRVERLMALYDAHGIDHAIAPENSGLVNQFIRNSMGGEPVMEVPVKTMTMEDFLLAQLEPSPEVKAKREELLRDIETLTGKPMDVMVAEDMAKGRQYLVR